MNILELGVFGIHCVAGYYGGKLLSEKVGVAGWPIGGIAGFALSFGCFYALAKYFERRADRGRSASKELNQDKGPSG